jgi:hypothetical protein
MRTQDDFSMPRTKCIWFLIDARFEVAISHASPEHPELAGRRCSALTDPSPIS